jgi:uncharacterized protein (TIGR02172 family)
VIRSYQDQINQPIAYGRQAEIYAWGEERVLKLFLGNWPEAARHEFAISQLAYTQGVKTPQPVEIVEKDGRPGIVFEKVKGPSLLKLLASHPWQIRSLARQFANLQHTVHHCQALGFPLARPELEKYIQSNQLISTQVKKSFLEIIRKLPDGDALLHGDFHPDNVMVTTHGMVIIDWPNAARGCPLADVARTSILLRFGEPVGKTSIGLLILSRFLRGVFRRAYLREYFCNSSYPQSSLMDWELILAAHRIGDNIPGEKGKLIKFIERNLH